jgi:dTDP-4-amino-4,6-dideoxygalactose transaminase
MNPSTEFIPFALPSIGAEEEEAVISVLRSGWLTTGKVARAFEEEFAAFVGSPHALAVNSATSGLHLALEAIGVGPGDLVVTTPYTFTSTAAVVRHLGAELLFCDISPSDYNLDPGRLESILRKNKRIKAVIPVHIGGLPCDMDRILGLCMKRGIRVIEDAAHAFPSRTAKGFAGTLGHVGVYSFYATKTITTGDGGMIVTSDSALASRMATMRTHGFDREAWDRYTSKKASWYYEVVEAGYKYNMPDLLAAVGRAQLAKAWRLLAERRAIAKAYDSAFGDLEGILLPPRDGTDSHSWHLYAIRTAAGKDSRDKLISYLTKSHIGTSVHFIPLHVMPYWSKRYSLKAGDFPEALAKFHNSLSLPIWPGMSPSQVGRVIECIVDRAQDLTKRHA